MTTTALKRILVVDDDPVVGKSFDRVLSPKGYAVIAAANGAEALARLEAENYDMVYADIKMPGMDGIEVARRIKASRPWLPVVIVTGYGTEANEKEARAIGVADFLKKPLSPETIEGSAHFAFSAVALPAPAPAASTSLSTWLMNIGLFFAAPFIGLAFILAVPFLGAGLVAWSVYRLIQVKIRGVRDAKLGSAMRS
jgi:CheY-like chemotaxis protein